MKNRVKYIVTCLILSMVTAVCYAQKLTVESFKLVSENASATENVAKDINDTPCAILKIKTTEKGLKLGGNVVGTALTNGKEYIANVATGTKKITIVGKETYPLTVYFSEYGINSLKSNASYEMILKTSVISTEVTGEIGGHEYVDLGLSVKWATCNIGTNRMEDLGDPYKYGETIRYDEDREYSYDAYDYCDDSFKSLPAKDDVAHTKWGGSWRIPTKLEFKELMDHCKHFWTFKNGTSGIVFVAENGNRLFLPAIKNEYNQEYIEYWTNGDGIHEDKYNMLDVYTGIGGLALYPYSGLYIRAVSDLPREPEVWQYTYSMKPDGYRNGYGYVDLGLSVKWATTNVGAKNSTDIGLRFRWGETTPIEDCENKSQYKFGMEDGYYNSSYDRVYGIKGDQQIHSEDDAASQERKSSNWRMPSKEELEELLTKCTWTWTYNYKNLGVNGYIITSNINGYTDKSIFLPQTNDNSNYWSSIRKLNKNEDGQLDTREAFTLCFSEIHKHIMTAYREFLYYVRPVCK